MKTYILDVECYVNYFLICIINYSDHNDRQYVEIHNNKITRKDFKPSKLLAENTIVTFNGEAYDLPMISGLINKFTNPSLKKLSDLLITSKEHWTQLIQFKLIKPKYHYDLFNISPGRSSLKLYGARLGTKTIQDLPIDPSATISTEQAAQLKEYCFNDCMVTIELATALKKQLNLRHKMSNELGVDLRSKSDAQIAEATISKKHGKYINRIGYNSDHVNFNAKLPFTFKSKQLQDLFQKAQTLSFKIGANGGVLIPDDMREPIELYGKKYQIGVGGLHSTEKKQYVEACDKMGIIDLDVSSYYPSLILNQDVEPEALKGSFRKIYKDIVDQRLHAKKTKDKTKADTLKITINGTFGKFGSKYSFLYAPQLLLQTTLSGQLHLLYLIESMEQQGFEVISANTDGIVIYYNKKHFDKLKSVASEWMKETSLTLDETHYSIIASRDVNNYVAITTDGDVKRKGAYAECSLSKNPVFSVSNSALVNYLKDNTPIEETIRQETNIAEFCSVRKVTGGAVFNNEYVGNTVRFYYTNDFKLDNYIKYKKNGNKVPLTDGAIPCQVLPDKLPKDIDYQRYIEITQGMLKDVGKNIEKALVQTVKALGGLAEKFTSPNKRSVPDRLVTLPGGRIIFVEVKAPGKKPTLKQDLDHQKRRALGCDVRVIDSMEQARCFPD